MKDDQTPAPDPANPSADPLPDPSKKASDPASPPQDPAPPSPLPAPPAAAKTALEGTRTERELALEAELEAERQKLKGEQTRIAALEDENRTLKTPPPTPSTEGRKAAAQKKSFLSGATFFDED